MWPISNLRMVLSSSVALIAPMAMLELAPQIAYAANECGAPVGRVVICSGTNYPSPGISYAASTGLTLNLNNAGLVVLKSSPGTGAVAITGGSGNIGDLVINAFLLQSVQSTGALSNGLYILNNGTAGNITIRMDTGTVTAAAASAGTSSIFALVNSSGTGNSQINLNGGQVSHTGGGSGAYAQNLGTGNAAITMTGGSVSTNTGAGLRAIINNTASFGTASVTIDAGTVTTTSGAGVLSQSERGGADITMTGGTVTVQGGTNPGLSAVVNNAAGTGTANIAMSGGTVTNNGSGDGLFASNKGAGTYDISLTGGTVTGGTVTGGSGTGAAIHGDATAGGTIAIGSGATVNAGASGIALSQTGGAATITTAGTVNGVINLSAAANTISITGGAINGNISGGGNSALSFDLGASNFIYGSAYAISDMGSVAMNSGAAEIGGSLATDTLAVNGGTLILNGTATVSGGTTISAGTLQLGNGGTTGSITGDVTNNGTLAFNRSDAYTFAGLILGSGAVNQIGAGTTILTADNSYTGGMTISAGTLELGSGGTSGSILGDVTNNGTLAFNRSDAYIFDGIISGSGTIRQIGSGLTRLTGDSSGFAGTTSVEAGTLSVNGSLCGDINVLSGGRLQGIGTVCDTDNAGIIAPGNSIGTLTVAGNYTGNGGTLEIETVLGDDTSATDRLVVTGDTSGSTNVKVVNAGGPGAQTTSDGIRVVQVDGASNGFFSL
ncbi:autotransporter outer membrane beta-barrel domain-containing protein, partial [Agrobacterium tumefaciens]